MDPINKVLGTRTIGIMPKQGMDNPGTMVPRGGAPPGMLRSLQTFRDGHPEGLLVEACIARKAGETSSGLRGHFLTISEVDCLGSAMGAVVMGSMAETIFPRIPKGADP